MKEDKFINFIDIGCRYGTHQYVKKNISKLKYFGIDADKQEINRLKKKYKSYKNIKLYNGALAEHSKEKTLNIYKHKGYISTKQINNKSLWFGILRKNEKEILTSKKISFIESELFFKKNKIPFKDILKLDVEGQELEIIKGFNKYISEFKAIIFEGHFDEPYKNASNFSKINLQLSKNFFIAHLDLSKSYLSQYFTNNIENTRITPLSADTIVLNKNYFNLNLINSSYLDILYVLDLYDLMLFFLQKKPQLINKSFFKNEINQKIGRILNNKLKEVGVNKNKVKNFYKKIFNKELPLNNKFNESNFFNPD